MVGLRLRSAATRRRSRGSSSGRVARVVVVNPADTGIRQARAKTDRLDAPALARLLAAGSLDEVWMPDQRTRVMRRRLGRREQSMASHAREEQ